MHVEIAKIDLGWRFTGSFISECQGLVIEDAVEERILDVVPSENF